jgi:hypothetical protein
LALHKKKQDFFILLVILLTRSILILGSIEIVVYSIIKIKFVNVVFFSISFHFYIVQFSRCIS